jgi:hypothetical protein
MSEKRSLWVLAGLARGADGHAVIKQWGPTSESQSLLACHEQSWRSSVEHTAVLRVLPGALLRVSQRDADDALRSR